MLCMYGHKLATVNETWISRIRCKYQFAISLIMIRCAGIKLRTAKSACKPVMKRTCMDSWVGLERTPPS